MTVAVLVTGLELWVFGLRFGSVWVGAHKLSFLIWLPATAIHVLGHLNRTSEAVKEEFTMPAEGALRRRSVLVSSLVAGAVLAAVSPTYASPFIFFRER